MAKKISDQTIKQRLEDIQEYHGFLPNSKEMKEQKSLALAKGYFCDDCMLYYSLDKIDSLVPKRVFEADSDLTQLICPKEHLRIFH